MKVTKLLIWRGSDRVLVEQTDGMQPSKHWSVLCDTESRIITDYWSKIHPVHCKNHRVHACWSLNNNFHEFKPTSPHWTQH